jgi:hypothetical protein
LILGCTSFVKQASALDSFAFDPFSFQQDGLTAPEVDVGRRQIVDALVVAQVIVVGDELRSEPRARRADSSSPAGCGAANSGRPVLADGWADFFLVLTALTALSLPRSWPLIFFWYCPLLTALSLSFRAREGRADPARSVGKTDPLEPPGRRCGCWPMSPISF